MLSSWMPRFDSLPALICLLGIDKFLSAGKARRRGHFVKSMSVRGRAQPSTPRHAAGPPRPQFHSKYGISACSAKAHAARDQAKLGRGQSQGTACRTGTCLGRDSCHALLGPHTVASVPVSLIIAMCCLALLSGAWCFVFECGWLCVAQREHTQQCAALLTHPCVYHTLRMPWASMLH